MYYTIVRFFGHYFVYILNMMSYGIHCLEAKREIFSKKALGEIRMENIRKLFEKPLPSFRTGAFFNTFSYPTKISPESIAVYIASMTKPGDTVLDTFSGSGSTGIASLLCENPTLRMKQLADDLGAAPVWGPRNAIGYEIGTYGTFAAKTITNRLRAEEFEETVNDFLDREEALLGDYYSAKDPDGGNGIIRYIIWSEVLLCPKCGEELPYFNHGTRRNPVQFKKQLNCPKCMHESAVEDMEYKVEEYYDGILKKKCMRKKRIPSWVYGTTEGRNWDRAANRSDVDQIHKLEIELSKLGDVPKEIKWGELHRSGYHFGISHLHQFYTPRNYMVMYKLWNNAGKYRAEIRDAIRLLLLSYNASHCTMMTRVVAKKNARDFVLTGAQSGVLYISKLPVEKNIFAGLKRKAISFYDAYKLLQNCTGEFTVRNLTSEKLLEKENFVDFVFTDPPFGDFIPYAEVNQINELWLDASTKRDDEIIISPSQKKDVDDYKNMLTNVFKEVKRTLKTNAYAAVVFHSAKAQIWAAFEDAIIDSGLNVELTNILDKKQASFKQVVSRDSVQGDPLLLLNKKQNDKSCIENEKQIIENLIVSMINDKKFDERRAYSLYVNECLRNNIYISHDAKDAYMLMRRLRKDILNAALQG